MQKGAAAYTGAPFCTSQGIRFGALLSSLDSAPLSDLLLGALGRSWALWDRSWASLGRYLVAPGTSLGASGLLFGTLGLPLGAPVASRPLRAALNSLGAALNSSETSHDSFKQP